MNKNDIFENYIQVQEYERKRIAREMHDTSLQTLAHLTHKVQLALLYMDKDVNQAKMEMVDIDVTLRKVIDEIRDTIYDLRPMTFDDLGIKAALQKAIRDIDEKSKIRYICEIDDFDLENESFRLELFRCIMECVNNCERHSGADNVEVIIKNDNGIHITVSDDGDGFDMNEYNKHRSSHFGLIILQERVNIMGGLFNIESKPGIGTTVSIVIP